MDKYIGFDIDSKKVVACVVEKGKMERFTTMSSELYSMIKYLKAQKADGSRVHLVFEISGQAGFLYDALCDYADSVTVANPSKMTWIYRTAKKNDRMDARKMAVLLSIGEIPSVYMPSREVRQWRQTILHRKGIVQKITAVKNSIRALLKSKGFCSPCHKGSWWKKANRQWMRALSEGMEKGSVNLFTVQLGNFLDELDVFNEQLRRLTEYLDNYLKAQAGSDILLSIPGVGPRTTEAVLAYTDDVERFSSYKEYCSYFGVTPRLDESGSSRRMGHISKLGPSVVRWVLCESSWKVIRYSPSIREFYERVRGGQKDRKKIAIVAVARKLLSIMRAMLLTGAVFDEKDVSSLEYGKIEKLRKSA